MTADFNEALQGDPSIPTIDHGTLTLIQFRALDRAITLAQRLSLSVIGMDGFQFIDGGPLPLLDYIADLSDIVGPWDERVRESTAAARRIGAAGSDGPEYVDLTVERGP